MAIENPVLVTDNDMIVRGDLQIDGTLTVGSGVTMGGTAVTATAAELNALDGITATVAELNVLHGSLITQNELTALAAQSYGQAYETKAAAGDAQGNAAAIYADFVLVTAADAAKGVILPGSGAGRQMIVKNNANAVLKVYPPTDGYINGLAQNGSLDMAAYTSALFVASSTTQWWTVPLLPS